MSVLGDLVVKITAKSDQFDGALTKAEKRLTGFAAKAAAPAAALAAGLGTIPGLLSSPIHTALAPVNAMFGMLPGGSLMGMSAVLGDTSEAFDRTADRYREMAHASEKFHVSGGFYRAFQVALGPEADQADKLLTKYVRWLATGQAGHQQFSGSAVTAARTTQDVAESIRRTAKEAQGLGESLQRDAILFERFGKGGLSAGRVLKDGALEKAAAKVEEYGLYDPRVGAITADVLKRRKDYKLRKEGFEGTAAALQAPFEKAGEALKVGQWFRGLTYGIEGVMGKVYYGLGLNSREDILKPWNGRPGMNEQEHRQNFLNDNPENKKHIDDIFGHYDKVGRSAEELEDGAIRAHREILDKLGATAAMMKNFEDLVAGAKLRSRLSPFEAAMKQFGLQETVRGLAPWEAAVRSAPGFDKAKPIQQEDWLKAAQQGARGEFDRAMRMPAGKAAEQIGHILGLRGGGFAERRGIAEVLNRTFNLDQLAGRAGGAVPFLAAGSQEAYALRDAMEATGGKDGVKFGVEQLRELARQQLDAEKQAVERLKDVIDAIKENGPQVINIGW